MESLNRLAKEVSKSFGVAKEKIYKQYVRSATDAKNFFNDNIKPTFNNIIDGFKEGEYQEHTKDNFYDNREYSKYDNLAGENADSTHSEF